MNKSKRIFRVADLFAGAGGASKAFKEAIRRLAKALGYDDVEFFAVNHWDVAVATYRANIKGGSALCTGVQNVEPLAHFKRGELHALIGGPECTEYSSAAGGKPTEYQYRPTPWCMLKWADALRPRYIMIENVPEFEDKWPPFQPWFDSFLALGYSGGKAVFNAADYGDPTTRKRLFMQFVMGRGLKVTWPFPTHGPNGADLLSKLQPWVSARKIIDWTLKGRWLDEMPGKKQYGGLPLSPKTLARIYAGLRKSGLKPVIAEWDNVSKKNAARSADEPLSTVTTKARHGLAVAHIVKMRGTNNVSSLDKPMPTITAGGQHLALAEAFILPQRSDAKAHSVEKPMPTITTTSRGIGLVEPEPFMIHTAHGKKRRHRSIDEPMPTIAGNRGDLALIEAILPQHGGGTVRSVDKPMATVTTAGALFLLEAFLVKYYGTGKSASIDEPFPTVTTKDRFALVCPVVVAKDGSYVRLRIRWRIVQWHELAAAQGFPGDYIFCGNKGRGKNKAIIPFGNKSDIVKQIGNAWPHHLGRALFLAMLSQESDITELLAKELVA